MTAAVRNGAVRPATARHDDVPRRYVMAVFTVALLVRLLALGMGPWQDPVRALNPDSRRYITLAHNLKDYRTFGQADGTEGFTHTSILALRAANGTLPAADAHGLRPEGVRTPVYPLFIAITEGPWRDLRWTVLVQCLIGAWMATGIMVIARGLGVSVSGALVCGLLWALHPGLVLHDQLIATESLFNAVVMASMLIAARSRSRLGPGLSGLTIAAAALVRPVLGLFYLPIVLVLGIARAKWTLKSAVVMCVMAVMPVAGWAARNQADGEGFRVSTISDINLLYYHAAFSISEEHHEDWRRAWDARLSQLADKLGSRLHPGDDVMSAARLLAIEELSARPVAAARVLLKSQVKMLIDHSLESAAPVFGKVYVPTGLFSRLVLRDADAASAPPANPSLLAAALIWTGLNVAIACAAVLAVAAGLRRRAWGLLLACVPTIALFAVATGAVGLERMRMPLMIPLLVLAASLRRPPSIAAVDYVMDDQAA
jgi:hypothetical protein